MGNKVRPPSEAGGVDVDDEDRCFHYRGYLLMCDPTRLLCGGYRAHAVVVKHDFIGSTTAASIGPSENGPRSSLRLGSARQLRYGRPISYLNVVNRGIQ